MQPQQKFQQNDATDIVIFNVFPLWKFFLQIPGGAKAPPVRGQGCYQDNTPPVSAPDCPVIVFLASEIDGSGFGPKTYFHSWNCLEIFFLTPQYHPAQIPPSQNNFLCPSYDNEANSFLRDRWIDRCAKSHRFSEQLSEIFDSHKPILIMSPEIYYCVMKMA